MGLSDKSFSAATGFQTRFVKKENLLENVLSRMNDPSKLEFEYIQRGLRGATDIFKKGGHVLATYRDRKYSFEFDNKRLVVDNNNNDVDKGRDTVP